MRKVLVMLAMCMALYASGHTSYVTLTYYQPVRAQCDSNPLVTADGSRINLQHLKDKKIRWCAVSRDLWGLFPKGREKRIWIEGFGVYHVHDKMNKRYTKRVDILVHPKHSIKITNKNVKIRIL